MPLHKESFFRVFRSDLRPTLQKFFENRSVRMSSEIVAEFAEIATIDRLTALQLIEFDQEGGEYRLDDRVERFFEEMLGAVEVAQADWLVGLLEELRRAIDGYQKLADLGKGEILIRRICRLLRACNSRAQRHLEDVRSAVDFDYRAGSDYAVKLLKLQWHLERARSYGEAIADLNNLLRNDAFFQVHQEIEMLSLRARLIRRCSHVGDALIGIYQGIEEYLNRILRDYARAQKLIRLRGLIERHEHLASTNLEELAEGAKGPWFREFRFRTLLAPGVIDHRPELLDRALARAGIAEGGGRTRRVELQDHPVDDLPPVIDWQNLFEAFSRQSEDLFIFLGKVRVEGRVLTEEERIDGFCAILTNEDWAETWDHHPFDVATADRWEYAVVRPPLVKS